MHELFLAALHGCRKILVTFCADKDGAIRRRTCLPMDFGPSKKHRDGVSRYWLWDCDSPDGPHTIGLLPSQISAIEPTEEAFDPASFIDWDPDWHVSRDWGAFS
jgi:hypothetical protein